MTLNLSDGNNDVVEITPAVLEKKLTEENTLIVDVREPDEFADGHIPKAISIPLGDLSDRANKLDSQSNVYVICRSGARSDFGAKILMNKGFKSVTNIVPGMMAWEGDIKTV